MDKLIITPAISEKLKKEIISGSENLWSKHYESLSKSSSDKTPYKLTEDFKALQVERNIDAGALYYFADNGKRERIGYFGAQPLENLVLIRALYIFSEFRKKGYGRRILRLIEKVAKVRGMRGVTIKLPAIDGKAMEFFKINKYTFVRADTENDGWGGEVVYHCLVKDLMLKE